jgi:hypothetical protein
MGVDKKDLEMMAVSVPVVDYWEMKEELDRLSDCVLRLEKILECFIALYSEERVKNWELILRAMLEKQKSKRENHGNRIR